MTISKAEGAAASAAAEIRSKICPKRSNKIATERSTGLEGCQEVRIRKLPDLDGAVGAAGEEPVVLVHVDLENALERRTKVCLYLIFSSVPIILSFQICTMPLTSIQIEHMTYVN